jgi:hypothetical protein
LLVVNIVVKKEGVVELNTKAQETSEMRLLFSDPPDERKSKFYIHMC